MSKKTKTGKKERVVVIGGSSGMGLSIAKAAHENGFDVLIASRSKEKLDRAKRQIGNITTQVLDATKEKEVARFFASLDGLDHLVISAADFMMGPFLKTSLEQARSFFESKFWGQYCAAKYAVPKIRKGGSVTFFCGYAAQKPMMDFAVGCAINAAIEGLTRALALELGPLRVNAIAPGTIETPVWDIVPKKEREAHFKQTAQKLPLKRIGQPEDIAQGVLFLMQCGFITGKVLYIDGGELLV